MEQSTVDEMLAWQSGVRLTAVADKLRARGFEAEVCDTREAARARVVALAHSTTASRTSRLRRRWKSCAAN